MTKEFINKAKRKARKELLEKANGYEPKRRKVLRNVSFKIDADGIHATWIGQAHNYSVFVAYINVW